MFAVFPIPRLPLLGTPVQNPLFVLHGLLCPHRGNCKMWSCRAGTSVAPDTSCSTAGPVVCAWYNYVSTVRCAQLNRMVWP